VRECLRVRELGTLAQNSLSVHTHPSRARMCVYAAAATAPVAASAGFATIALEMAEVAAAAAAAAALFRFTHASLLSRDTISVEALASSAPCSGVMPCAFFALASAFAARRRRTTSMCPRLAARRSGVSPLALRMSTVAPQRSSASTTSTEPLCAPACSSDQESNIPPTRRVSAVSFSALSSLSSASALPPAASVYASVDASVAAAGPQ